MNHTEEPWAFGTERTTVIPITGANGKTVVSVRYGPTDLCDARRIIACVNACAGTSTERLAAIVAEGESFERRLINARKDAERLAEQRNDLRHELDATILALGSAKGQRDALLEALKMVSDSGVSLADPIERAMLDAIAKATA